MPIEPAADIQSGAEIQRLLGIFDKFRKRLLDLTLRNPMLNYKPLSRSRKHLQIIDDTLEDVASRLIKEALILDVVALPDLDDEPEDECTEDFASHLAYLKATDEEYRKSLKEFADRGEDDEIRIAALDRHLKDKVREQLELPPRPDRKKLDLAEHAKSHGVNPVIELGTEGRKTGARRKRLQTLLLSESLEPRIEAIRSLARLSEQEMGFSTLYVAFGFLEWRQSDTSDKCLLAPLLLLPVVLETRVESGRKIYGVRAVSEAPEANVTLIKLVEDDFKRTLPDFEADEDTDVSINAYLSQVEQAIDGLSGWRIRRYLTLGHFAFGRLAMYQDLDVDKWEAPVEHPIVGSLLSGIERTEQRPGEMEASGLPEVPEDYPIDAPEIEAVAPLLVHDADASQHSAIVDVMKDFNLVVEGPPGTGKSQTITNVIANVLARDESRTVLFLSEKLAALEVVKRRLDVAGLGDFCLELHSEKSSPKEVVESLKTRGAIGSGKGYGKQPDESALSLRQWGAARQEIATYIEALHENEHAGDCAFTLFSRAIAGSSAFAELPDPIKRANFPQDLLTNEERLRDTIAALEDYQGRAIAFRQDYGYPPSQSIWAPLGLTASPGQALRIREALASIRDAGARVAGMSAEIEEAGFPAHDLLGAAVAISLIPDAPDVNGIEDVLNIEPLLVVEASDDAERSRALQEELASNPLHGRVGTEVIEATRRLEKKVWDPSFRGLSCREILRRAGDWAARSRRVQERSETLAPIRKLLQIDDEFPVESQETLALAPVVAAAIPESEREWLSRKIPEEGAHFDALRETWARLREADDLWVRKLPTYSHTGGASHQELTDAAASLDDKSAPFVPWKRANRKKAKEVAATLGIDPDGPSTAKTLADLAEHIKAIDAFEHGDGPSVVGPLWKGMATPFDHISWAVNARVAIMKQLAAHPGGERVAAALISSEAETIGKLSDLMGPVVSSRRLQNEEVAPFQNAPICRAILIASADARTAEAALACDSDGVLNDVEFTLEDVVAYGRLVDSERRAAATLEAKTAGRAVRGMLKRSGDVDRLLAAAHWVEKVRAIGLPEPVTRRLLCPACAYELANARALRERIVEVDRDLKEKIAGFDVALPREVGELVDLCDQLSIETGQLGDFLAQAEARRALVGEGLEAFLSAVEQAGLEPERFRQVLEQVLIRRRAERANRHEALANARGATLDARRRTFAEQDKLKIARDRKDAREKLGRRQPRYGNDSGPRKHWTEMALLKNEMRKQQRFTNVRSLLQRAPQSIRALKPCFMMSPLSVAKFLPRDMTFDLLIIDEASQMRPEDALGALLRARQVVVVGDPKQLPPTDFFNRSADNPDDEEEIEDVQDESILEACSKSFRRVRTLKWHYRSRCESLIDFSNRQFYGNTLITFPMARPNSFSIDLVHVDGAYEANQNPAEAQRVCEEAISLMRLLADAGDSHFGTIGVVTVNTAQRDCIIENFRLIASGYDAVERYLARAEARAEPFFVKNLENVQGDERDFIMISLVFGREPGRNVVKQNFGPINRTEGHRRLNVLFSRARRRIGLFTSMRSTDVQPTENSSRGVHVLRAYLEYAERRGGLTAAAQTMTTTARSRRPWRNA